MEKWAIFEVDTNKGKRLAFNLEDEPIGMLIKGNLTYENVTTEIQDVSKQMNIPIYGVLTENLLFY